MLLSNPHYTTYLRRHQRQMAANACMRMRSLLLSHTAGAHRHLTVIWHGTQVLAAALVGSPYSDDWRNVDDSGSEASGGPPGGSEGSASGEASVEAAVHAAVHDAVAVCLGCLDPVLLPLPACAVAAVLLQLAAQPRTRPEPQVPIEGDSIYSGRSSLRQALVLLLVHKSAMPTREFSCQT